MYAPKTSMQSAYIYTFEHMNIWIYNIVYIYVFGYMHTQLTINNTIRIHDIYTDVHTNKHAQKHRQTHTYVCVCI